MSHKKATKYLFTYVYIFIYLQKVFPFAYTEFVWQLYFFLYCSLEYLKAPAASYSGPWYVCVCLRSHPELCEVNLSSIAQFCSWSCPHPHHRRGVRHTDRMRCSLWGAICSFHHPSINQRVSRKDVEEVIWGWWWVEHDSQSIPMKVWWLVTWRTDWLTRCEELSPHSGLLAERDKCSIIVLLCYYWVLWHPQVHPNPRSPNNLMKWIKIYLCGKGELGQNRLKSSSSSSGDLFFWCTPGGLLDSHEMVF